MKPIESLFNDPKNHPLEGNWWVSGGANGVAGGPMTTWARMQSVVSLCLIQGLIYGIRL